MTKKLEEKRINEQREKEKEKRLADTAADDYKWLITNTGKQPLLVAEISDDKARGVVLSPGSICTINLDIEKGVSCFTIQPFIPPMMNC